MSNKELLDIFSALTESNPGKVRLAALDSLEEAKEMIDSGNCEWVCDYVDGDVIDIEEAN